MEQLKIYIVDDEMLIRNLIKMRVDWQAMGMEIVGEAASAREALEEIEQLKPDIVFTDICMPFMDGLELSRIIREQYPQIRVVIVTGHDEFDYAQKSVKIGVSDFLLKPVVPDEIRRVAGEIRKDILESRNRKQHEEYFRQQIVQNFPYLRERFLNELIHGMVREEVLAEKCAYFGIRAEGASPRLQVAVVEIRGNGQENRQDEESGLYLQLRGLDVVRAYFTKNSGVWVFADAQNRIVILSTQPELSLHAMGEDLRIQLLGFGDSVISIGIGGVRDSFSDISLSYEEACYAVELKLIHGTNQIMTYRESTGSAEPKSYRKMDLQMLKFYIVAGVRENAMTLLSDFFQQFTCCRCIGIETLRLEAFGMVLMLQQLAQERQEEGFMLWENPGMPFDEISRADTIPRLRSYLEDTVGQAIAKVSKQACRKDTQLIDSIREFIQNHIQDTELSLKSVAQEFFISPSHLSRVFRQKTSQTFVEYINALRMEKAMQMVSSSDIKLIAVCREIGIEDPHYLSILFKKHFGMTINEFRKQQALSVGENA